jgi:hypothetical protein
MKKLLSVLFILSAFAYSSYAQSDLPGQNVVDSVFEPSELDKEENLNKCCFAVYGWHIAAEVKTGNSPIPLSLDDGDIAATLLLKGITPLYEEQYFVLDDGRIVVISSISTFEKVLFRFTINANSLNR